MNNYLSISELNPVFFFKKGLALPPQYNTKFRDQFLEEATRKPWQGYGFYAQKWQTNDIIRLQFISNVAPITLFIYDCKGIRRKAPLLFTQKQQNRYSPGTFIYEASLALTDLPRGRYRLEVTIGDPVAETLESDWLDIADVWPNTVLWEYTNSFYYGDAIFATGWAPSFRLEAWFKPKPPASKDEIYEDQVLNQTMLYSDPFVVQTCIIGPSTGVPLWTPDKMIWILGCDNLTGDGKLFTKAEGAKFEEEEIPNYPLRGYTIDLRESLRRTSRVFPVDPTVGGKKLLVAMNVETAGFADTTTGASSNVIEITSVE